MKTSLRTLVTLLIASIILAFGAAYVGAGPGIQAGASRPAGAVTTYATPALLAAAPTSGLTAGATAALANMGTWIYQPTCPAYCDGAATCVTAAGVDGGLGCWGRLPGGIPGATLRSYWSDSNLGNDANDCAAPGAATTPGGHGACQSFSEPWRRVSKQTFDGSKGIYPVFTATGDFSNENIEIEAYLINNAFPSIQCSRSYTGSGIGVDGGGYNGVVTAAVTWDGGAHQEGIYSVASAADGGTPASFLATATTPDAGFMLEYTSGANVGGSLLIGEPRDAGVFASPGGQLNYSGIEPAVGNGVRLYRPTHAGAIVTIRIHGSGDVVISDCDLGPYSNAAHSVFLTGDASGDALLVPISSSLRGVEQQAGSNLQPIGSMVSRETTYGYTYCVSSLMAGHTRPALNGVLELADRCMVAGDTISGVGQVSEGGMANVTVSGGSMITNYSSLGGLQLYYPGTLNISAPFWVWGSPTSSGPAIMIQSGIVATYASGFAPVATGTQSGTPLKVAGTSYALSALPVTGFVVQQ